MRSEENISSDILLMEVFESLYGVGPQLSKELHERLGDLSEKELRRRLRSPDIFYDLPLATRTDLLFYPLKEIPREIVSIIDEELGKWCYLRFKVAGSYIRGKKISHDVDVVMQSDRESALKVIRKINRKSDRLYFYPPYMGGEVKINFIVEVKVPASLKDTLRSHLTVNGMVRIKLDIFLTTRDSWMYTLLFATGSGKFNVRMRAVAKKKGYCLNQYGLYRSGKKVPLKGEKELFALLGISYLSPSQRVH